MEFLTFHRFDKKEEALFFSEILKKNHIDFLIEDTGNSLDSNFGNSDLLIEYLLKIRKPDFSKAEELSAASSTERLEDVDPDYFLFGFTNEELHDVVLKKDEWGDLNYALAQKILKDRGAEVSGEQIESMQQKRLLQLAEPEKSQSEWVIIGYVSAFLGGLLGIFIGWHLKTFKKTLPNGDRVFNYSVSDRKHGESILVIGKVFLLIWIFISLFKTFILE
jgi:hypothetical protein